MGRGKYKNRRGTYLLVDEDLVVVDKFRLKASAINGRLDWQKKFGGKYKIMKA